jgi:hypothetical protein
MLDATFRHHLKMIKEQEKLNLIKDQETMLDKDELSLQSLAADQPTFIGS